MIVLIISIIICVRLSIYFDCLSSIYLLLHHSVIPSVILIISYLIWLRFQYVEQYNKLPGHKAILGVYGTIPIIIQNRRGNAMALSTQELIASLPMLNFDKRGNQGIFVLFMGPMPLVVITKPDIARQILSHKSTQVKGQHYSIIRACIGDGLITLNGSKWSNHRKLLTPAFHLKILQSVSAVSIPNANILTKLLDNEASKNIDRSIDNLTPFIFDCTLDVLCHSSMGIDVASQLNPGTGINAFLRRAFDLFAIVCVTPWMWIPILRSFSKIGRELQGHIDSVKNLSQTVLNARMVELKKQMSGESTIELDEEISKRKVQEPFMDIMIHQHIRDEKSITVDEMVAETQTFLIAGHDTTGWALNYTIMLLGLHSNVQEKVHQEIDKYFSENDENSLTQETVKQFIYLDAVIKETMRLYPPIPLISRKAEESIEINDMIIPKGSQVLLSISCIHRDKDYWSEPARFKPERFLIDPPHPYAHLPFSAGSRNCIGQRYAMIQLKIELIILLRKFYIQSITQQDDIAHYFVPVCQTEAPIRVKLFHREVNNNNV